MGIVPLEISGKQFRKAMRGYDPAEVKEFLEQVAEEMGRILAEKAALERELGAMKDNLSKYHEIEDTIKETLVLAQKTKDELLESAKKKAELIVEEAHHQGVKVEERFAQTRAAKKQFQIEFETLIESFRQRLSDLREPDAGQGADTEK